MVAIGEQLLKGWACTGLQSVQAWVKDEDVQIGGQGTGRPFQPFGNEKEEEEDCNLRVEEFCCYLIFNFKFFFKKENNTLKTQEGQAILNRDE